MVSILQQKGLYVGLPVQVMQVLGLSGRIEGHGQERQHLEGSAGVS